MLTYPELLQTLSTVSGFLGAGCAVYATFLAHRVHGTVQELHETIKDQRPSEGTA
jgi:hypothetical protein